MTQPGTPVLGGSTAQTDVSGPGEAGGERQLPLTLYQFADALIQSRDLDPVYVCLCRVDMDEDQLYRWMYAYWCFYHMGLASFLSEFRGNIYWERLVEAARNDTLSPLKGRWPRGTERRHFRGPKCVAALERGRHAPLYDLLAPVLRLDSADAIVKYVSNEWPLFGPWIGFKVADMLEVVMGQPIKFEASLPLLYKEPAAALTLIAEDRGLALSGSDFDGHGIYGELIQYVSRYREPAAGHRACGVQEAETVLCKYKSHRNGHYPVGKDTHEIRLALEGWGLTASKLLSVAP